MSKNKQTNGSNGLDQLATLIGDNHAPAPKLALIGKTEQAYLDAALDKASQTLHPNFVHAASTGTLQVYRRIQATVLRISNGFTGTPKQCAIAIGRELKDDVRSYVTFWTGLMSNVAFAGHMDLLAFERVANPDALESSLDAMGDEHPYEQGDRPAFDRSTDTLCAPQERQEAATLADTPDDVYEAMTSIQQWIELAFVGMTIDQRAYWGLDETVPFCKRGQDADYAPIVDFDEYREFQTENWKNKQRVVKTDDAERLMEAA